MESLLTSRLLGDDRHQMFSDYHLSPELAISGISKTYLCTDLKMWFDIHLDVEVGIQVQGRSERTMGSQTRVVGPGDVWFVGIFERHGHRVIEAPCEVAVLIVSPTMLADLLMPEIPARNWLDVFSLPPERRPQTTADLRPVILELATRIQRGIAMDGNAGRLLNRLALIELLVLLTPGAGGRATRATRALEGPARIATAVELALRSRRLVSHDEAAAACGLGRHQFRRAFEAVLGIPFTKFALHHRLQRAAVELAYTDKHTRAIASDWGFSDESHLSHAFTREYGCGPRAYRQQHRTT